MYNLQNKIVLVTGASGGIGSSIAKKLDSLGAKVILTGTRKDALKKTSASLANLQKFYTCELANIKDIENLVTSIQNEVGSIDILVNNAGTTRDNILARMKQDEWQKVIEINLTATFNLSRLVLRKMLTNKWGRIINITSIVATTGNVGQTNYTASKAGMIGFSKSLALEVARRNITVNCVAPGFIETAMTDKLDENIKKDLMARIPMNKLGIPEDVANCVAFLSSEQSSYITGQTIHVNGGMALY